MTAPITLHRLNPDDLSSYTRSRLRHLTNGSALYIPGSPAAEFQPHHPPRLYRHPYTSTQMPLLEGTFNTLTSGTAETWLISLAHLAHADCPACQATWTETADRLDTLPANIPLFHTQQLGAHYLLLHREDQP